VESQPSLDKPVDTPLAFLDDERWKQNRASSARAILNGLEGW
jgi:hypothetical protein